jgi:site-specific DNA-methyltransferase (adenine-specific)
MNASVFPLSSNGPRRRPTSTSSFGVGRRESHDATPFYERFTAPRLSDDDEVNRPGAVDEVWCADAREMQSFIGPGSVALVVTSPPYFAGKAYEEAMGHGHVPADYGAYLEMLSAVFAQCYAVLEPGGRIAVNVANLGRKPYRSLSGDVTRILEELGYLLRGEIVWQKGHGASGSCAWGTYQRPGNPVLRDLTERVVVACKGRFDRARTALQRDDEGLPHEGSMSMDEFVDATLDIWDMPAESATRVGHPAPFPVELPRRLIELYTYRGDLVLDPFMGSGSTAVAAVRTERHFVGFDTEPEYVERALQRVDDERASMAQPSRLARRVVVSASRREEHTAIGNDVQWGAVHEGEKAKELARRLLLAAGFDGVEPDVKIGDLGVDVTFRARDRRGEPWLFDVSGAFSITRPGLKRLDSAFKALGKASVIHAARAGRDRRDLGPLVLLSTDLPPRRSAGGRALATVTGDDAPVRDVIELLDPDAPRRLRELARGRR